jgi:parvulin-like peptidyl-prolyl isomerase
VQSGYGWHLLYILKREGTALIPFEPNKEMVISKYKEAAKEIQNKKIFEAIESNYIIKRTYLDGK